MPDTLGMIPDEAKEYDERRQLITQLNQELSLQGKAP